MTLLFFIIIGLMLIYSFIVGICGYFNLTVKEGIEHFLIKFKKKKETYPLDNVIGYIAGVDPINTRNDNIISIYEQPNTSPTQQYLNSTVPTMIENYLNNIYLPTVQRPISPLPTNYLKITYRKPFKLHRK